MLSALARTSSYDERSKCEDIEPMSRSLNNGRMSWANPTSGMARAGHRLRPHRRKRLEDHVGHGLRLGDHDHVRALDLCDFRAGPLGFRADDVGAGRLVPGGHYGPP